MSSAPAQRHAGDVEMGDRVSRIEMDVSLRTTVLNAAATWDFYPGHHDHEYARSQGQPTNYVNTMFLEGFVDRAVTDWAGPQTFIRRRRMRLQRSVFVGETVFAEGRVVGVDRQDDGSELVELEMIIGTEAGVACPTFVVAQLPVRTAR